MKNSISIANRNILQTSAGYEFIPLGHAEKLFGQGGMLDQALDRVFRRNRAPVEDFWATLGRRDGKKIDWSGTLDCSGQGNDRSFGVTDEEIKLLKELHPEIQASGKRALEKFISFDRVQFGPGDSRKLRLTVMVQPDEGALVYYQHTDVDDALSERGDLEYIMPQPTDGNTVQNRDRLDYFFEVPEGLEERDRFVVKVITFRRQAAADSRGILSLVEKPYRLLRYNAAINDFDDLGNAGIPTLDRKLKTLLLVHGTFSTTANSYSGLIASGWLKNAIDTGMYQQVLALDHPTILQGARHNVDMLMSLVGPGPRFELPVHIITTSRGGLVGKTIVNDANVHNNFFTVERMAAVACANGVEYFTAGWKIAKMLSVLKALFKLTGLGQLSIITGVAQHSAEFFLKQPGAVVMTPGSDALKEILSGSPQNKGMRYLPVTGDFIPDTTKQKLVDLLVRSVYKSDPNDWVVGTKQQAIMPTEHYAYGKKGWGYDYYLGNTFNSTHTKYLTIDPPASLIPRDHIRTFLSAKYEEIL